MKEFLSRRSVTVVFTACALLTVSVAIAHFAVIGFGVYGDGLGYFAPLRSLVFDHDLDVTNEYQYFAETYSRFSGDSRWPHDIPRYSKYTIGMAVVLAPFYGFAHVVVSVLAWGGVSGVAPDGLSWPYELFFCLGSVSIGLAGLVTVYRACRLFFARLPSLLAVLGVWFASPVSYYLLIENSMSHAVSQGLVSALVYVALRGIVKREKPRPVVMGFLLGLAALVRPQNAFFVIVPVAALLARFDGRNIKPTLVAAAWLGGVFVLCLIAQLWVYMIQYGTIMESPYMLEGLAEGSGSSFNWSSPALYLSLFSGHRGLFLWHPITFIGTVGLMVLGGRNKIVGGLTAAALFLQIYLVAAWHCWWQAASVGSRMLSCGTAIFALGLAAVWSRCRGRRIVIAVFATLFFMFWNTLLVAQYMSRMIPTESPVTARTLLENQTKVIPHFLKYVWQQNQDER